MKRFLAILLILAFAFAIVSCDFSGNDKDDDKTNDGSNPDGGDTNDGDGGSTDDTGSGKPTETPIIDWEMDEN